VGTVEAGKLVEIAGAGLSLSDLSEIQAKLKRTEWPLSESGQPRR